MYELQSLRLMLEDESLDAQNTYGKIKEKEGSRTEGEKMRRKEGKMLKIYDQHLNGNKENAPSKVQE